MKFFERLGLAALHNLDPETAHSASILALKAGLVPMPKPSYYPRLVSEVAGLKLSNPLGLAAGYDKNATAIHPLSNAGFGFLEVGAATPVPQPGNPKPRLFRLSEDRAAINRFGFNNDGMDAIADRLRTRPTSLPVGLNLGANKTSEDRAGDFARVLATCGPVIDFATVNVSSPNTERLRDLQGPAALEALLKGVMDARSALSRPIPVFLKIAPDLTPDEIVEIAEVATTAQIDAIVATNTTLARDGLKSRHASEAGGLSGAPVFEKSTRVLAQLSKATDGKIPLIGVGGISSADDAWAKIMAGASALQIYTGLIYGGLSLISEILSGLDSHMERAGFTHLEQAKGTGRDAWL